MSLVESLGETCGFPHDFIAPKNDHKPTETLTSVDLPLCKRPITAHVRTEPCISSAPGPEKTSVLGQNLTHGAELCHGAGAHRHSAPPALSDKTFWGQTCSMRSAEHQQGPLDLPKHGSLQTDRGENLTPCVQQTHSAAGCDQEICSDAQQK